MSGKYNAGRLPRPNTAYEACNVSRHHIITPAGSWTSTSVPSSLALPAGGRQVTPEPGGQLLPPGRPDPLPVLPYHQGQDDARGAHPPPGGPCPTHRLPQAGAFPAKAHGTALSQSIAMFKSMETIMKTQHLNWQLTHGQTLEPGGLKPGGFQSAVLSTRYTAETVSQYAKMSRPSRTISRMSAASSWAASRVAGARRTARHRPLRFDPGHGLRHPQHHRDCRGSSSPTTAGSTPPTSTSRISRACADHPTVTPGEPG